MENEIIKGKSFNVKRICSILAIVAITVGLTAYSYFLLKAYIGDSDIKEHFGIYIVAWFAFLFGSDYSGYVFFERLIVPVLIVVVIFLVIRWWLGSMEIVVTDKRVYGRAAFGKRVDLPIDSISAVSISFMHGITVATSSGRISFKFIENNEEVHKTISTMLIKRQEKSESMATIKQEVAQSSADEIAKFKALLDSGAITQEEYDAKKKQLLGL